MFFVFNIHLLIACVLTGLLPEDPPCFFFIILPKKNVSGGGLCGEPFKGFVRRISGLIRFSAAFVSSQEAIWGSPGGSQH